MVWKYVDNLHLEITSMLPDSYSSAMENSHAKCEILR